jgi:lysosomal alpha-mannosidase
MNDEACPYYTQIIDNMMIGHKFLKEELGITAKIGWHIDPFGHSSANAALFADMGFDAFFYSRLDYQDKEKRLKDKSMEYVWRPFPEDNPDGKEIFTHAMFDHYYPPPGFCWATSTCGYYDEPIVADDRLKTFNYKERIAEMYEWVSHMKDHYRTNHLLIPMGGDFFYKNAHKIFINTDRLIKYFNEEYDDFKLAYSTPGEYLKAVHDSGVTFPVKYADQFPYAEKAFSYWTGYFSSRAVSKGNIRQLERYVSLMNTRWTNTILNEKIPKDIKEKVLHQSQEALRIVGVMQHHDAVTGTERQHVADDYQAQIDQITNSTGELHSEVLKVWLESEFGEGIVESIKVCKKQSDQSLECPDHLFDEDENTYILVEKNSDEAIVRINLPNGKFKLINPKTFEDAPNQMIFCSDVLEEKTVDETDCRLEMRDKTEEISVYQLVKDESAPYLFNDHYCDRIWNNYQSLMITRLMPDHFIVWAVMCDTPREDPFFGDKSLCVERNLTISLRAYNAYEGDDQPSGAYVFRPENGTDDSSPYSEMFGFLCYKKENITHGALKFVTDKGNITLALHEDDVYGIQMLTEFTGIQDTDKGIEVTLNVQPIGFDNDKVFYTDSNGLQMQKRVLDERPDWKLKIEGTEHITANYYPINSALTMQDKTRRDWFTLLNDRSQGGSVLKPGRAEVMIDRRLYKDDYKGLEEALNETDAYGNPLPVDLQSIILIEKNMQNFSASYDHSRMKIAQKRLASDVEATIVKTKKESSFTLSNGFISIQPNLFYQIYPVAFDEIILRIENAEDYLTHPEMTYLKFDITELAKAIYVSANGGKVPASVSIQEVTLSASENLDERAKHKLMWKTEQGDTKIGQNRKKDELYRQEMRTYRVKYADKGSSLITATE